MFKFLHFKNLLRMLQVGIGIACLMLLFILFCNLLVINSGKNQIYNDINKIPAKKIGLLLGTKRMLNSGRENLYFKYRIDVAVDLFHKGKIKHIIVSGDNHTHTYNEPEDMWQALVERGVPENKITLDFAGFRTLDSVVRCQKVFQQNSFIIISQRFHNQRALFIANKYDLDALAFDAKNVGAAYGWRIKYREYLAKVKAVLDIYVLRTQPKFLGEKITIQN